MKSTATARPGRYYPVLVTTLVGLLAATRLAIANPPKNTHADVELVANGTHIAPGGSVQLGVKFKLEPQWHIYWKNPGDSGQAPKVLWTLPPGFAVSDLVWPTPKRIASGPLMNYGYENSALLQAKLSAPDPLPPELKGAKTVSITGDVRFLTCREDCIPGEAEVTLSLPLHPGGQGLPAETVALFADAAEAAPQVIEGVQVSDQGTHVAVEFARPTGVPVGTKVTLVPETALVVANAVPQVFEETEGALRVLAEKHDPAAAISEFAGLIVTETSARRAFAFASAVQAAEAAKAPEAVAVNVPAQAPTTLWLALGLAFLGGILLNLMPCVFPVLSLKILGFVSHAHEPRKARLHGWAYTAGVFASFWALALVLVIVRAGSSKLGWGFQLQSPVFVALLCGLMVLVGLNLLGVFEVGLSLTQVGGSVGNGYMGSFNTGVLATVVATPCTAPFMGTALGFALTRPAFESLAVFTALAAGMAFPYVWLSHAPSVLKRLPRPGKWMEILRQFLAFPILATVVWLLAVFNQLTGPLAVFELLGALLVVSMAAWIYGAFQRSSGRPGLAVLLALASAGTAAWLAVGAAQTPLVSSSNPQNASSETFWQPWSPARVAELQAKGQAVFVNFTAAWCISCKANELLVFSTPEIQDAFAKHRVVPMKADWTNRDETIAKELETHGRAGVPLYLFYPAGVGRQPATLPSVLTKGIVLDALAQAKP
jgi:thiol:disulfide interchange protein DsbD